MQKNNVVKVVLALQFVRSICSAKCYYYYYRLFRHKGSIKH